MKKTRFRSSAVVKGALVAVCSLPLIVVAQMAVGFVAAGGVTADHMCEVGEYPVKAVGNTTGGACQQDGTRPPAGDVSYPRGEVPQYVGDKWDNFWSDVVVNERGQIVDGHGHLLSRNGSVVVRNGLVVQGQGQS